ncbi:large ribosomal subunit protein mL45 [Austrofundulus limnaeus]|uniref:Large ribosomal subunit protein mL45 n=1 Tax=Austrofundulus limnaeus TaxID=52670 RepID=A0A2I4CK69_AUSLI|nr:PREDICTED: 39S ribosomal protein L45, mitochondrial [Austrofundulus limnaeus]
MAAFMRTSLVSLCSKTCYTLKKAEVLLDVRHAAPLFLPVRTVKSVKRLYRTMGKKSKKGKEGFVIRQQYIERPINITCTGGIFDPYIPPEGDARLSSLSKEGLKQRTEQIRQSAASLLMVRKIKQYDPQFNPKTFGEEAQNIFIEAHNSLANFDKVKLHSLVTERCYPEMIWNNRYKTIRWRFVESLEPPRVVHVRCTDMVSKDNLYGQVTVRMHSRQILAIYDRFGRLMLGGEDQPKDVLEYVVIERQLHNPYGSWRLHGKIVPSWAPAKEPIIKTIAFPGPRLEPWEEFEPQDKEVPKPAV